MAPLILTLGLLGWATWCDLKTREVPDWISITIAVTAVFSSAFGWLDLQLGLVFLGGAIAALIGLALFRFAQMGGGDVKLIAALGLLLGPGGITILLVLMAIAGGALAIVAMFRSQRDYAYVPAITLGYIGCLAIVVWNSSGSH